MSRKQKLSLVIISLGICYVLIAIISFVTYWHSVKIFSDYGISPSEQQQIDKIAQVQNPLLGASIVFTVLSIPTLLIGINVYKSRAWAEIAWVIVITLLLVFHLLRLYFDYKLSTAILLGRIGEVSLIGLISVYSYRVLFIAKESKSNESKSLLA
jgi:hypothetical protein